LVQQLAARLNIELLYLPSYSPNLNLIERVWKFVKKEALRGTYTVGRRMLPCTLQGGIGRIWTRSEPCPRVNED
jgi:transposase